jgi:cholesterol transport system auxiliary component
MTQPSFRFFAAPALAFALACSALLSGCATDSQSVALYDLGPLHAPNPAEAAPSLPAISVAEAQAPAWLDSQMMFYRLNYANDQQPRPYSASKWTMPPVQLFVQRLKSRLSQAGGVVIPASDGGVNLPVLRIEADDFSQMFDSASHSRAYIAMRASLFDGRTLRTQKMFIKQVPAASPDAQGGAAALADASDAIINEMAVWLATLPAKK